MAPLPYNNTDIMTFTYSWDHGTSQFQIRYDAGIASEAFVAQSATDFLNTLGGVLDDQWTIIASRRQSQGTNVSVPSVMPTGLSITGLSQQSQNRPLELTFVGRSNTGRRAELSIFGTLFTANDKYRYLASTTSEIANALNVLNDDVNYQGVFLAIDGTRPLWYPYANVNYNSYWERRQRVT